MFEQKRWQIATTKATDLKQCIIKQATPSCPGHFDVYFKGQGQTDDIYMKRVPTVDRDTFNNLKAGDGAQMYFADGRQKQLPRIMKKGFTRNETIVDLTPEVTYWNHMNQGQGAHKQLYTSSLTTPKGASEILSYYFWNPPESPRFWKDPLTGIEYLFVCRPENKTYAGMFWTLAKINISTGGVTEIDLVDNHPCEDWNHLTAVIAADCYFVLGSMAGNEAEGEYWTSVHHMECYDCKTLALKWQFVFPDENTVLTPYLNGVAELICPYFGNGLQWAREEYGDWGGPEGNYIFVYCIMYNTYYGQYLCYQWEIDIETGGHNWYDYYSIYDNWVYPVEYVWEWDSGFFEDLHRDANNYPDSAGEAILHGFITSPNGEWHTSKAFGSNRAWVETTDWSVDEYDYHIENWDPKGWPEEGISTVFPKYALHLTDDHLIWYTEWNESQNIGVLGYATSLADYIEALGQVAIIRHWHCPGPPTHDPPHDPPNPGEGDYEYGYAMDYEEGEAWWSDDPEVALADALIAGATFEVTEEGSIYTIKKFRPVVHVQSFKEGEDWNPPVSSSYIKEQTYDTLIPYTPSSPPIFYGGGKRSKSFTADLTFPGQYICPGLPTHNPPHDPPDPDFDEWVTDDAAVRAWYGLSEDEEIVYEHTRKHGQTLYCPHDPVHDPPSEGEGDYYRDFVEYRIGSFMQFGVEGATPEMDGTTYYLTIFQREASHSKCPELSFQVNAGNYISHSSAIDDAKNLIVFFPQNTDAYHLGVLKGNCAFEIRKKNITCMNYMTWELKWEYPISEMSEIKSTDPHAFKYYPMGCGFIMNDNVYFAITNVTDVVILYVINIDTGVLISRAEYGIEDPIQMDDGTGYCLSEIIASSNGDIIINSGEKMYKIPNR